MFSSTLVYFISGLGFDPVCLSDIWQTAKKRSFLHDQYNRVCLFLANMWAFDSIIPFVNTTQLCQKCEFWLLSTMQQINPIRLSFIFISLYRFILLFSPLVSSLCLHVLVLPSDSQFYYFVQIFLCIMYVCMHGCMWVYVCVCMYVCDVHIF